MSSIRDTVPLQPLPFDEVTRRLEGGRVPAEIESLGLVARGPQLGDGTGGQLLVGTVGGRRRSEGQQKAGDDHQQRACARCDRTSKEAGAWRHHSHPLPDVCALLTTPAAGLALRIGMGRAILCSSVRPCMRPFCVWEPGGSDYPLRSRNG